MRLEWLSDLSKVFRDETETQSAGDLVRLLKQRGELRDEGDEEILFCGSHLDLPFLLLREEAGEHGALRLEFQLRGLNEGERVRADVYEILDVPVTLAAFEEEDRVDENYLRRAPGLYPDLLRLRATWEAESRSTVFHTLLPEKSGVRFLLSLTAEKEGAELFCAESAKAVSLRRLELSLCCRKDGERQTACAEGELRFPFLPLRLPESSYLHTEWFHADCLSDYYHLESMSEEHFRAMEAFMRKAREIHADTILVPVLTPPLDIEDKGHRSSAQLLRVRVERHASDGSGFGEVYSFDTRNLRRYLRMAEEQGFRYFEIAHFFSQWGAKTAIDVYAEEDGRTIRLFDAETAALDPRYLRFLRALIRELKSLANEMGLLDRLIFHLSDEPSIEAVGHYAKLYQALEEELRGCRRIDALSDREFFLEAHAEEPVIALNALSSFREVMPPNQKYWIYFCVAQSKDSVNRFMSLPVSRQRSLAPLLFFSGAIGFLHWGFNFYNSQYSLSHINPYEVTDAGGNFIAGDAFLFYPGEDFEPEWSLRALSLRKVFEELALIEQLVACRGGEEVKTRLAEAFDYGKKEHSYAHDAASYKKVKQVFLSLLLESIG